MAWIVKGSGTAEFRGAHSCRVEFQTENTATGEIRRERKTFRVSAHTKKERERCKREFRAELETGLDRDFRTTTFGEYAERWYQQRLASPEIAAQTSAMEKTRIKTINLKFENWRITEITRMDVKEFQTALMSPLADGRCRTLRGRPLSGSTAQGVRKTLKLILQEAVRDGIIARNPCEDVKAPSNDTREKEPLSPQEVARFKAILDSEVPEPRLVAFRLALFAGLRRGEVCALRWRDFDEEAGAITVSQSLCNVSKQFKETKTEAGVRTIPLDADTVAYLSLYRSLQAPRIVAYGRSVEDACITAYPDRDFMRPMFVTQSLYRFARDHGFEGISPHLLRHTYCTLLFAAGVDLKTAQYLMGHASPNVTLKIYTHYLQSNGEKAAVAVKALMDSLPSAGVTSQAPAPARLLVESGGRAAPPAMGEGGARLALVV